MNIYGEIVMVFDDATPGWFHFTFTSLGFKENKNAVFFFHKYTEFVLQGESCVSEKQLLPELLERFRSSFI